MTATIPADIAKAIGLLAEGDEVTLYAEKVNPDGSVYVASDHDEDYAESDLDEETTAPGTASTPPPPVSTEEEEPMGTAIIIARRKAKRVPV